jgi:hypothetical protein
MRVPRRSACVQATLWWWSKVPMMIALALAAAMAGEFTLSDRSEVRLRLPGINPPGASLDLETAPEARLVLGSRRVECGLAYTPRLTLWDVNVVGVDPAVLHGGEARAGWHDRRIRLTLDETASYGQMNFAALTPTSGPQGAPQRVDVIPTARVLNYESSTTTLTSRIALPRWVLGSAIGYQLSGGADADARAVLPLQYGPLGELTATRSLSRLDDSITTLSGSESTFSSGPELVLVEADEGWRHAWTRTTETRLTLGASEARTRASPAAPHSFETDPVAEADLRQRFLAEEDRVDAQGSVRLGPVVNRLLGIVDERIQGAVGAAWTHGRYEVRASGSAAQSVHASSATAVALVLGEVALSYRLSKYTLLDFGVRGLWQKQAETLQTPGQPDQIVHATFLQGVAFIGITFRALEFRV